MGIRYVDPRRALQSDLFQEIDPIEINIQPTTSVCCVYENSDGLLYPGLSWRTAIYLVDGGTFYATDSYREHDRFVRKEKWYICTDNEAFAKIMEEWEWYND